MKAQDDPLVFHHKYSQNNVVEVDPHDMKFNVHNDRNIQVLKYDMKKITKLSLQSL